MGVFFGQEKWEKLGSKPSGDRGTDRYCSSANGLSSSFIILNMIAQQMGIFYRKINLRPLGRTSIHSHEQMEK